MSSISKYSHKTDIAITIVIKSAKNRLKIRHFQMFERNTYEYEKFTIYRPEKLN